MSVRAEFVTLSIVESASVRELCRRFGGSPKTGHKWIARLRSEGAAGLADRSQRPTAAPIETPRSIRFKCGITVKLATCRNGR